DPLSRHRHRRRQGRAPRPGPLRRRHRLPGRPVRGRALVGRRRCSLPPRRRPRRRPDGDAAEPRAHRADRAGARRAGPGRRRAALAAVGPRRPAGRRLAGHPRHRRLHRRRLPRRGARRVRRAGRRLRGRPRRVRHDQGLDRDDADAVRGGHRAAHRARRAAVRLLERRPRRHARRRGRRGGPADRRGRSGSLPVLRRRRDARGPPGACRAAPGEPGRRHRRQGALRGPLPRVRRPARARRQGRRGL
ncbi:MAG: Phosphoribosylformimino-5-aminoimidazole carboxamide ribotide isomerase, partial [uncultured Solirubrobacteraceae bacterium]